MPGFSHIFLFCRDCPSGALLTSVVAILFFSAHAGARCLKVKQEIAETGLFHLRLTVHMGLLGTSTGRMKV